MISLLQRDALLSHLSGQLWPFEPLLSALALPATADVLDIGAGAGRLLALLRMRGHSGQLAGLDPEPGPGVMRGRAEQLPFPGNHFDAAFFIRTLLHVVDFSQALAEARCVLKPGGRVIVTVQGAGHLAAFWALFGPSDEGADVATARLLTEWPFERLDIRLPVTLKTQDVWAIAESYAVPMLPVDTDLADHLHLTLFTLRKF
ncbi:class I SAM-dependent methyltransferase [Deinococcus sp.]|uniref:class I SAM-dependent methyltransferase n=1 Tax=Deinococcus sp. TaxID=47478 RepID=UPI003B5AB987